MVKRVAAAVAYFVLAAHSALSAEGPRPAATTQLQAVRTTPAGDAVAITWEATEAAAIGGWTVEWGAFSPLTGGLFCMKALLKPGTRRHVIAGLSPGRAYSVRVYPFARQGEAIAPAPVAGATNPVSARVGKPTAAKPAAPRNLRALADAARIRIEWTPSEEINVAGYEVARKAADDDRLNPYAQLLIKNPVPVVTSAVAALRATGVAELLDTAVAEGTEYEYSVRAFTDAEKPDYSDPAGPVKVKAERHVFRPSDVLLVVNANAKAARAIAANYCRARGVPTDNVVRVSVPVGAEIARDTYEKQLLAPVQTSLRQNPRVTVLLLVRGIPWRIQESGRSTNPQRYHGWDRASVESELALARAGPYPLEGRVQNPLYGRAAALTPIDRVLGVCRLDGPDDRTANELVQRATDAEARGLEGIAFFDLGGPYPAGDAPIRAAAELVRKDGRLKVQLDESKNVVDLSTLRDRICLYYGWYDETFAPKNKGFRFGRGALGAHLHSFAAYDIAADKYWVGPMLAHGAAAVLGTADEPLLDGFPTADAFVDALLKGRNFAEAALSASRYLSWMTVAIGDPLYRPFKPKN